MIKKLLLTAVICCMASSVFARSYGSKYDDYSSNRYNSYYEKDNRHKSYYKDDYAYEARNQVSLGLGLSMLMQDAKYENNTPWGKNPGYNFYLQYLRFINDNFAIGGEIGTDIFSNTTVWDEYESATFKTTTFNFLLSAKYVLIKNENARFYIPFGLGVQRVNFKEKDVDHLYGDTDNYSFKDTSPVGYIGLGAETLLDSDLSQNGKITAGVELRLNYSSHEFTDDGDEWRRNLPYASLVVKIGNMF